MINVDMIETNYPTYPINGGQTVTIKELPYFADEQYDLMNPKDATKFIKDLEGVVRTSFEYRQLMAFLRDTEGMNECTFLRNVTNTDNTNVRIEIHHTPFTLYDIAMSVTARRVSHGESLDIFDVAKEIMWLHYAGWVGLIPVCETVHQMIHSAYLFVPTNVIRGDYEEFIDAYGAFIDTGVMEAAEKTEATTLNFLENPDPSSFIIKQMELFNIHPTQVRIENLVPRQEAVEEAKMLVRKRINQLKSGKPLLYRVVREPK